MMSAPIKRPAGFMLVELLLVVAIIALVVVAYYGLNRKAGEGDDETMARSTPAQAMDAAKKAECANNLHNLRLLIESQRTIEGDYPQTFNPGKSGGMTHCPVSGKPYQYDPATGRIWCTTPGHESL